MVEVDAAIADVGEQREQLVVLRPVPFADRDPPARPGDAARLRERELDVECVLERIEAGHDVERRVRPRQVLEQPEAQIRSGQALERLLETRGVDIDPVHGSAPPAGEGAEASDSAPDVEDAHARPNAR